MKAIVLTKDGSAEDAFEFQEMNKPLPGPNQVRIQVSHFGLNYADIMARKGMYNGRPPLPCVLGYEVVGIVDEVGEGVTTCSKVDRVLALTLFGGYAEFAIADVRGAVKLDSDTDAAVATCLATQYATAWYASHMMMNLRKGDHVLIHAAAGGVGTALVQMAKWKGCVVFGTASNPDKIAYLRSQGVDYPINYAEVSFEEEVRRVVGSRDLDAAFDPIGGKNFKKTMRLLGTGGRMVTFGASEWSASKGSLIDKIKLAFGFGFLHPIALLMQSKTLIGVNMLEVGSHRPEYLSVCMQEVYEHYKRGILRPTVDSVFDAQQIASAHKRLEGRGSIGKVVMKW
jgi:NADPH:quinone reductase-like Zn-dependent oxidoreductase